MGEMIAFPKVSCPLTRLMGRVDEGEFALLWELHKPKVLHSSRASCLRCRHKDGMSTIFFEANGLRFFGECPKAVFDDFWLRNKPFRPDEFFILLTASMNAAKAGTTWRR